MIRAVIFVRAISAAPTSRATSMWWGRKSAFIKVGANRVEPAEVENILRLHPNVSEALVYGVMIGDVDEAVHAEVITVGQTTEPALLNFCAKHLDAYKCPRRILLRDDLPRNVHGKIIRPNPPSTD